MAQARHPGAEAARTARQAALRFGERAGLALSAAVAGLRRLRERLQMEDLPRSRRRAAALHETWHQARLRLLAAEDELRRSGQRGVAQRASCDDERLEVRRARARLDEAEGRVEAIRRSLAELDRVGEPLATACLGHDLAIAGLVDGLALHLDRAAEAIDRYHEASAPGTAHA